MKQFYVIGNPIAHSKSPIIHKHFAEQFGINIEYDLKHCELNEFENDLIQMINQGDAGANVTLPFKERAFEFCDEVSDRATLSKAVNTLIFKDGKSFGDNTDGEGLVQDLLYNKVEIENKRILIIGAGGATRGCIPSLLAQHPKSIMITNRTINKATKIVDELSLLNESSNVFAAPALELEAHFDIIINATSSSINGKLPGIPEQLLINADCVYDMFYSKQNTVFLEHAKSCNQNIQIIDGLGMLIEQAAEAFYVTHNKRPKTKELRATLRSSL